MLADGDTNVIFGTEFGGDSFAVDDFGGHGGAK
jgi:hypothetical protein